MRISRWVICILVVLAALIPCAQAQEVRATIVGAVTDSSDAAVPGATVKVTNLERNTTVTVESNASGSFITPFLTPGTYRLEIEAKGFQKYVRDNMTLQAQERARLDVKLTLGELTQSVMVTGSATQLETETASRSQVVASEIIANLPTQGRNPFQIAWAASGVVKSGAWRYLRSFDIAGTTGISINGGREGQNEVLLDGISNVRAEWTVISIPTTESVQEFKVQASTFDAQYGRTSGGVITIVTKGGGNAFHGTAFEYFQNDKLNANQSELNQPATVAGVFYPKGRKPPNHINQFGAMGSGPIIIPKLFNGRNRVFWMLSWESMRQRSADPDVKTFPIPEIRGGDFSQLFNAAGQQVLIYDPTTTIADGTRTPFAGNRIPSSRLDPVALKLLTFYPQPSAQGTGPARINNYPYPSMWRASFDQFVGRTDVVVNSKNNVFFRYNENPFSEYRAIVFGLGNQAEPSGNTPLLRNGRNVMMNWTSTLTPTMTFDLRAGLNRWEDAGGSTIGAGYDPKQLGFDPALVAQYKAYQFPYIGLEGYQNIGSNAVSPGIRDTYSAQPNLNKVMGRHFLKMGAEVRQYNRANYGGGYPSGIFSFNKNWTQAVSNRADAVSGNSLATFLLGYPSGASVQKNIDPYYRHYYYAGFFHDDWKITPKLSINMGLRWDAESGNVERFNRMVNGLDFNAASPIANRVTGLKLTGAVVFAGLSGAPQALIDTPRNNWQPRVGAAYRLGDAWVVRGGYGLYYMGEDQLGSSNGFSRQTDAVVSSDGLTPYPGMKTANPFVALPGGKLLDPVGSSLGASSFLGEGVTAFMRDRALPHVHTYSFDIQRQLKGSVLLEVGYAGNTARRLPINGLQLNYVPTSELGKRTSTGVIDNAYYTALVPNPMAGLIPNNAALNGATIQRQILWRSYPQYGSVSMNSVPTGSAQFHGVNFKVTKRMSNGLSFLSSYGIGKNLRQTRILNQQDFTLAGWGNTVRVKEPDQNIDTPQKFVIAGIYELPFGKGKKWATGASGFMNQLIGGWQINYDVTYQKGWVVDYPNAPQNAPGSAKLDNPTRTQVFNTSLWKTASGTPVATQEAFTLRTFPYLFSDVRRPAYKNWDASLSKIFPIHEEIRLQFRFEMVNMMNHPWFANVASTDVTNAAFGRLSPTQSNLPRFIKLAMHLTF
ncbi:MAG: TonB-dependent receptor [Candidatus Solibacter usitatus]|nr:TonB-dependent receptor [Candidatus Solibacter usitatus]